MKDKEFLIWIHGRLIGHGENQNCDYMLKFKAIIDITPPDRETHIVRRGSKYRVHTTKIKRSRFLHSKIA